MQYKETGMSGFSVKRVNVVGAFASLWAFIFAFFPFYRIEPMEVLIQQAGKQAESYALTKNLVSYNFFGVLCLMLSIVAFGLYIWNSSQYKRYQINNYICCSVQWLWNEDQYVCKDIRSIWICA